MYRTLQVLAMPLVVVCIGASVVPDTESDILLPGTVVEEKAIFSEADVELMALVTMAEAEGECEEGKRLVIDTVLNRVDSEYFPDTVYKVVYQENQFSSMWNGRVERVMATEELCQMVEEEIESRTNTDVIFFNAEHYSEYGEPLFQVGNHYFSSY